jgi:hypothetical protein
MCQPACPLHDLWAYAQIATRIGAVQEFIADDEVTADLNSELPEENFGDGLEIHHRGNVMSDYNEELSKLHHRVVQIVLQIPATIDDMGWILFNDPDLGEMTINLREYNPEFMHLTGVVFEDYQNTRAYEDLLRACNSANFELNSSQELARLVVSENYNVVRASVALVVAEPNTMPGEAFLKTVIVRAMSSIKAAGKEFGEALQKIG